MTSFTRRRRHLNYIAARLDSFAAALVANNARVTEGATNETACGMAVAQKRERPVNSREDPTSTGGLPRGLPLPPVLYRGGPSAVEVLGLCADLDSDE